MVGVAHEAFLSAWPPLAEAITAASTALRARRHDRAGRRRLGRRTGSRRHRLWERGQLAAALADTGAHLQASSQAHGAPRPRRHRADANHARQRHRAAAPNRLGHRMVVADRVELSRRLETSCREHPPRPAPPRRSTAILSTLLVLAVRRRRHRLHPATGGRHSDGRASGSRPPACWSPKPKPHSTPATRGPRYGSARPPTASIPTRKPRPAWSTSLVNTRFAGSSTGHTDTVHAVAFAPDGHTLATASRGQHGAAVGRHRPDPTDAASATR